MRFGFESIRDALSKRFRLLAECNTGEGKVYGFPRLASDDEEEPADVVLVLDGESLGKLPSPHRNLAVICMGRANEDFAADFGTDYIVVGPDASLAQVYSHIVMLYSRAMEWERTVSDLIDKGSGIQDILDAGAAVMGNPLYYASDQLDEVVCSYDPADNAALGEKYPSHRRFGRGLMTFEDVDEATVREYKTHTEPFVAEYLAPENQEAIGTLLCTVRERGVSGFVGMVPFRKPVEAVDFSYISQVARFVERYHRTLVSMTSVAGSGMHALLRQLLDGTADPRLVKRQFRNFAGPCEGMLICCEVAFETGSRERIPLPYLALKAERAYPDKTFAFVRNESIVVLLVDCEEAPAQLALSFEELGGAVGQSMPFSDVISFPTYHLQARRAREMGPPAAHIGNLHRFEDALIPYLLHYGTTEMSAHALRFPGFARLLDYNDSSSVDYLETLRQLIACNFNTSEAARALFVNRSTMLFRMRQIEAVSGTRLDDAEDRFALALMLRLTVG